MKRKKKITTNMAKTTTKATLIIMIIVMIIIIMIITMICRKGLGLSHIPNIMFARYEKIECKILQTFISSTTLRKTCKYDNDDKDRNQI